MPNPEQALENVRFSPSYNQGDFKFDEGLGFFTAETIAPYRSYLGFGVPFSRNGFNEDAVVTPITELYNVPDEFQKIDLLGKGVGPRMYNTPGAALGFTVLPNWIGAYTFVVADHKLLDRRSSQGGKVTQIARHAGRMLRTFTNGIDSVVEGIHESYGDADAVLLSQPPRAEIRQKTERHAPDVGGVPGEFMIIRNSFIQLYRVGTVPVNPWR